MSRKHCVKQYLLTMSQYGSCTGCGKCLKVCPTYSLYRTETAGPRGRLSLALGWAERRIQARELAQAFVTCLHCGKCEKACPLALRLNELFFAMAAELRKFLKPSFPLRMLEDLPLNWPRLADFLQPPVAVIRNFRSSRKKDPLLQVLPKEPFRLGKTDGDASNEPRILLYAGCLARHILPDIAVSCAKAFEKAGYQVIAPTDLGCCGRPMLMRGARITRGVIRNLTIIEKTNFDFLVSPCPACLDTIRHLWPILSGLTDQQRHLAQRLAASTRNLGTLIAADQPGGDKSQKRIFWHASCLMECEENQDIVKALTSLSDNIASGENQDCCGTPLKCLPSLAGRGQTNKAGERLKQEAAALGKQLRSRILQSDVQEVITGCPGCILGIIRSLEHDGQDTPVRHYIEALVIKKAEKSHKF